MVHLLLSDNLVFARLVPMATSLSFFAHQCHAYLMLLYPVISLCSYTLMGTNLSSELSTITSQITPTQISAKA